MHRMHAYKQGGEGGHRPKVASLDNQVPPSYFFTGFMRRSAVYKFVKMKTRNCQAGTFFAEKVVCFAGWLGPV